jgi:hypothetical protein
MGKWRDAVGRAVRNVIAATGLVGREQPSGWVAANRRYETLFADPCIACGHSGSVTLKAYSGYGAWDIWPEMWRWRSYRCSYCHSQIQVTKHENRQIDVSIITPPPQGFIAAHPMKPEAEMMSVGVVTDHAGLISK